jgi:hypothetical protein
MAGFSFFCPVLPLLSLLVCSNPASLLLFYAVSPPAAESLLAGFFGRSIETVEITFLFLDSAD